MAILAAAAEPTGMSAGARGERCRGGHHYLLHAASVRAWTRTLRSCAQFRLGEVFLVAIAMALIDPDRLASLGMNLPPWRVFLVPPQAASAGRPALRARAYTPARRAANDPRLPQSRTMRAEFLAGVNVEVASTGGSEALMASGDATEVWEYRPV